MAQGWVNTRTRIKFMCTTAANIRSIKERLIARERRAVRTFMRN